MRQSRGMAVLCAQERNPDLWRGGEKALSLHWGWFVAPVLPTGSPADGFIGQTPAPVERSSRVGVVTTSRLPRSPIYSVRLMIMKGVPNPISTKVMVVVPRQEYKVFVVGSNGGFGESYYNEEPWDWKYSASLIYDVYADSNWLV